MLINLLPDFFAVLASSDRVAAYYRYYEAHRPTLAAYWHNYVVEPEGPHFEEVVRATVSADRSDLMAMLERTDVVALARQAEEGTKALLEADVDVDVVLMVGVGAANAGELVVDGRGIAFVCLEHFTGVANPETQGLALDPELIPLWLAHEIAHAVRYTSPSSRSEIKDFVESAGGFYSYWETGTRCTLAELTINEGLAVEVARLVRPGHAAWEYYGYSRRQFSKVRELEPLIRRAMLEEFERSALGLRLRFLSSGTTDDARTVDRVVIPERAGYFIGSRLVQPALEVHGAAWAVRASAEEIMGVAGAAAISA